jgi:uncharacterized protein
MEQSSLNHGKLTLSMNKYQPRSEWFAHKPYGIHGIGHASRVFVWVNVIAKELSHSGTAVDVEALRWAAVLHDVGRLSDGIDRGHGVRSADWVRANQRLIPSALPDETFERILLCCQWHEIGDSEIPVMTSEIMCIKDADGLDRVRINDLNPDFLRSGPARVMAEHARDLFRTTHLANGQWNEIIHVAQTKGYL